MVGPGVCSDCNRRQPRTACLERFGGVRLCAACIRHRDWVEEMKPRFVYYAEAIRAGVYTDQC